MFCRSVRLQASSSAPEKTAHGEPAEKPGMKGTLEASGDSFLIIPPNRVSLISPSRLHVCPVSIDSLLDPFLSHYMQHKLRMYSCVHTSFGSNDIKSL